MCEASNTNSYNYDAAGNRTGVWLNGTRTITQTFNAANQVDGFTYDAAGNLTDDGSATYSYDPLGRLGARDGVFYGYNGDGALVARMDDDTTTSYTQDLAAPLSQILQTTQISTTNYLYGLDRLAAQRGSAKTWYVGDALGSVRLTLDDAGAPLDVVNYDPWGTVKTGGIIVTPVQRNPRTARAAVPTRAAMLSCRIRPMRKARLTHPARHDPTDRAATGALSASNEPAEG